jgi:hypothetical protein
MAKKKKKRQKKPKPKRLSYYKQSIRRLKKHIKQAESEATDKFLPPSENAEIDAEIEEELERRKFFARSREAKKFYADADKFKNYIQENFGSELKYSKKYLFPRGWMRNDSKINAMMENRPIVIDVINYITNLTRHLSTEQRKEMFELTKSVIGNEKYEGRHPYATFVANDDFYQTMQCEIGYSVSRIKAVFGELVDIGAVRKLGTVATGERGSPPGLYADGYLITERRRKVPFLKNTKDFRIALRALSQKNLPMN